MSINISRGTSGAISEHIVCADLMAKGFEAYKACSPNSSCDVLALRAGATFRVEIRTASKLSEAVTFPYSDKDAGRQDCVAVVTNAGSVVYYAVTRHCPADLTVTPIPERRYKVRRKGEFKVHPHAAVG